jgi:hypothetical protein
MIVSTLGVGMHLGRFASLHGDTGHADCTGSFYGTGFSREEAGVGTLATAA